MKRRKSQKPASPKPANRKPLPFVYTAVRHALSRDTSADEQAIRDALAGERKQH